MCGICGVFNFTDQPIGPTQIQELETVASLMDRRGPDSKGKWNDEKCALSFRRLSIIDLSESGNQPMVSDDGHYVLVFNGEVYNFREIRSLLEKEGFKFRSSSDSEVVLYALKCWGTVALKKFNGMFALAFYDKAKRKVLLARDHSGIKPLYYHTSEDGLVFASQYDQIIRHTWVRSAKVSVEAVNLYLHFGYVPSPYAMLEGTGMLDPGTWMEFSESGTVKQGKYYEYPQYSIPEIKGKEAFEAFNDVFKRAVKRHMVSDVPIGIFLSGGIDSPLVGAELSRNTDEVIDAFTIGVEHSDMDESSDAAIYAQELGFNHHIKHISQNDALGFFDEVVSACSEPTADYSIFPTFLVSKLAAQKVKVILSGDGGDEPFFGYPSRMGGPIRQAKYFANPYPLKIANIMMRKYFNFGCATSEILADSIGDLCLKKESLASIDFLNETFPCRGGFPKDFNVFKFNGVDQDRAAQYVRWLEYKLHLPRVLLKVDRASMYHSLEVRVPLLDKEIIEFSSKVDWKSCIDLKTGIGKLPLRSCLRTHTKFQTQNKKGFTVPIDDWLKGHFRDLFHEAVLNRNEILGIPLNRDALMRSYKKFIEGRQGLSWILWSVFMLSIWEEKHLNGRV